MLSLFREQEVPMGREFALTRARELLVSSLNKGIIPRWEDFFQELPTLNEAEDLEAIKNNFMKLVHWEFLQDILERPGTEYFFHGPECSQVLNYSGKKQKIEVPLTIEDWQLWLEIISIHFKQNWNVEQPFASFYGELFGRQFRLTLVHWSTSPNKSSKLVLRSLAAKPHALNSFGETEALEKLVSEKKNMLIAGSTGSGKTSLLTSLLNLIPEDEHLVILEDTYEILSPHPHQTRFLAGKSQETSLKAYLSYSLRLSPDRIILGEMRSHEVTPFLMAMNTGHKGLMGTIHASSAVDALHRVALLFSLYSGEANLSFEKVMELICRNLETVVFMENKKVKEVIKILGSEKGVPFFEVIKEGNQEINLF
ncbi:CpaF/VirB11 family protein [Peredibacter starrii]|uniref:CpaF/VirB11 family protein n=1 Tax=Peredibacter starrii TaxID=28202 RepID=A0AAX4HLZ0_9BACT|nr:CpaF/VirB11 family protein [Peredibacter starrii]WPU64241.1 CpaF/VirB11 family protein [Peredibacter starrii]